MSGVSIFKVLIASLLLSCSLIQKVSGQKTVTDSLHHALSQAFTEQEKFELSYKFIRALLNQYPDSAFQLLETVIPEVTQWAQNAEQKYVASTLIDIQAYIFLKKGQPERALENFKYAVSLLESTDSVRRKAFIFNSLGSTYGMGQQYDSSLFYFHKAYTLFKQKSDTLNSARSLIQMGATHYLQSDFPQAIDKLLQGDNLLDNTTEFEQQFIGLDILVDVYGSLEDTVNTRKYLNKLIGVFNQAFGGEAHPVISMAKGKLAFLDGKYQESIALLRAYIRQAPTYQNAKAIFAFMDIALAYEALGQNDSAFTYFDRTYQNIVVESGIPLIKINSILGLNRIYQQRNQIAQALRICEEGYALATQSGLLMKRLELAEVLYQLYKLKGDDRKTYQFLELSTQLKDTVYNGKKMREFARMEAEFEFQQEKQQLAFEGEQEKLKQKNIRRFLYVGLSVLAILLLIGLFYFRSKQKANRQLSSLNEELRDQKDLVEQQKEKLEELDDLKSKFFTNISHEFRTPLTIISGMAEQIKSKPEKWSEQGGEMITQSAQNLLNLVNQILDLQKLESKELKVHFIQGDIVGYIGYIAGSFHSLAENQEVKLTYTPAVEQLIMDYDPEKILRILSNLLSNAVKFTAKTQNPEKQVTITLHEMQMEEQEHLQIQVADTGPGIPKDQVDHIFDRFYQVDGQPANQVEGTGVGLALTLELVKLLKGTIQVTSEEGVGTTFIVRIPITHTSEISSQPLEMAISQLANRSHSNPKPVQTPVIPTESEGEAKPHVLIVEDNRDVQQFLVACLQDDFDLSIAEDGQAGIEQAIERIPDLIVSDVMMPRKDGFEVCDYLKQDKRTSHIPIVLLTARADDASRISGLERGADAYLAKPFNPAELLVRLRKLLELRRKLQQRYSSGEPLAPSDDPIVQQEDEFITKFRNLVIAHLDDSEFGADELRKEFGVSRSQLYNKVKALTGRSVSLFIRSIRLHQAKEMLANSDQSISEVAYATGFSDPSYFSRVFNKEFGFRPKKMKE